MSVPFANFIEDHHGSFQVFCENKSDELELFETLLNAGLVKDDIMMRYMSVLLSKTYFIRYPRQDFFRMVMFDGDYRYVFKGWGGSGSFSNLYDKETYTPYRFEEVMEYYLGSRDQQIDLEVTNGDLLCLM